MASPPNDPDRIELSDIDWLKGSTLLPRAQDVSAGEGSPREANSSERAASSRTDIPDDKSRNDSRAVQNAQQQPPVVAMAPVQITVPRDPRDRTVNRKLRGIHIFMITISGVLGVGLYVRSGTILRIGGPVAVLLSFFFLGVLAWLVMQCIAEMLCIWPISGALIEFPRTFVDEDLAITVGVAYWFTYSIAFAALIAATAGEADYWYPGKAIDGVVLFFLIPGILILLNAFGVAIYGFTELVGGTIKLLFALFIIIVMIAINLGAGPNKGPRTELLRTGNVFPFDDEVADNWGTAFLMCLAIAAFSFVGVEITAATALEARARPGATMNGHGPASPSVKFTATWTAFIAMMIYFVAGLLMTLNVKWDDPGLPRVSWLGSPVQNSSSTQGNTNSGFVLSAKESGIPGMADVFTVFLLITALTAANTNLYVASRTLFGLTRELQYGRWYSYITWLSFFGRTNSYKVPVRAMALSCLFLWVPFLYLAPRNTPGTAIATLLEVLSEMGSVSCVIVWVCNVWAYIRFYFCLQKHQVALQAPEDNPTDQRFAHVRRFLYDEDDDRYPWRSHGQPVTMILALAGCLFVLIVANGASLWKGFNKTPFLTAYLAPLFFLTLWLVVKIYRAGGIRHVEWRLTDLSDPHAVKLKIVRLDDIRFRATVDEDEVQPPGWGNLWGLV
ncbi:amino acid transporter [Lepidopterella palustris CBS 459.81]|uniref:Amino acid transporter n=1 Tax=Lepidopterella palustris CBS 459.81 TaxID=1314670 RepID=A0A8E2E6J7_9PEZI|nr:amino acid transporter [Lepidopterella palustris CBS 459.81]